MTRLQPSPREKISGVAVNVITGFLGAGKSTAILHLLQHKPEHERWAVLVNEFGEVGIDGSLMQGQEAEADGIFIREVPGGCMCCTAGLPMQVAMATLLAQGRPHRLLIEPTGLGHPREVLDTLGAPHYRETLDLQATITVVDARKVRDARYTDHDTFRQQLEVADVIVANKVDRYEADDLSALRRYLDQLGGPGERPLHAVEQGALDPRWLAAPVGGRGPDHGHDDQGHDRDRDHDHDHGHAHDHRDDHSSHVQMPTVPEIPASGFLRIDNEGEGFFSQGWVFDPAWTFDEQKVYLLLIGVDAERVKGVFRTDKGTAGYNMVDQVLTTSTLDETPDSRVEIISTSQDAFRGLEQGLLDCVISR